MQHGIIPPTIGVREPLHARNGTLGGEKMVTQERQWPAGATVTWTNNDEVAHTVTWDDRSVDSGLLSKGQTPATTTIWDVVCVVQTAYPQVQWC